jgi:hypothetical protein
VQLDGPKTDSQPQVPSGMQQAISIDVRHVRSVLQAIKLHVEGPLSWGAVTHIPPEHASPWLLQS